MTESHVQSSDPPAAPAEDMPRPPRTRRIAMINQKGGVGKTTSTVNLGAALAEAGQRVLMIDLDPQAHMSLHLGVNPETLDKTMYDLLADDETSAYEIAQEVDDNLVVLPAEMNLAGVEAELAPKMVTGMAQRVLRDKVEALIAEEAGLATRDSGLREDDNPQSRSPATPNPEPRHFDYVIIDCPPSLGLLTINALVLAHEVIVPMQAHFLALQGLSKLLETVRLVKQSFNPNLSVSGILLCMHESQTILAGEVMADLKAFFDANRQLDVPWRNAEVLQPPVRRNIKLAECPSFGKTIFQYEPSCAGAQDYRALARAVARQHQ